MYISTAGRVLYSQCMSVLLEDIMQRKQVDDRVARTDVCISS